MVLVATSSATTLWKGEWPSAAAIGGSSAPGVPNPLAPCGGAPLQRMCSLHHTGVAHLEQLRG